MFRTVAVIFVQSWFKECSFSLVITILVWFCFRKHIWSVFNMGSGELTFTSFYWYIECLIFQMYSHHNNFLKQNSFSENTVIAWSCIILKWYNSKFSWKFFSKILNGYFWICPRNCDSCYDVLFHEFGYINETKGTSSFHTTVLHDSLIFLFVCGGAEMRQYWSSRHT